MGAQNTNAMLTTFNELDMSAIMQLRKDNQDAFVKKHGIKMGFMSAFVKASAYALTKQPTVNAVIEGQETIYRDYVDISVAVATPKGLVVPVLRNVERMNYADVEKGIAELGKKAKNNQISIEDMDGGTFTISNGGVFGSLFGTPIINAWLMGARLSPSLGQSRTLWKTQGSCSWTSRSDPTIHHQNFHAKRGSKAA